MAKALNTYIVKRGLDYNDIYPKLITYYKKNGIIVSNKILARDTEFAIYVVDSILFRHYVYKRDKLRNFTRHFEYVKLYSQFFKRMNNDYKRVIKCLAENGMIEIFTTPKTNKETYYAPKSKSKLAKGASKQYRITKAYYINDNVFGEYKYLSDKIIKYKLEYKEKLKVNENPIYSYLGEFTKDLKLNFGLKYAENHKYALTIWNKMQDDLIIDNSGRNYTKLSNIFSFARNFMTYKGDKLFSIDCTNSQPLLLYKLWISRRGTKYNDNYPTDILLYKDLVENGTFYEFVLNKLNEYGETITRKEVKVELYSSIFFNQFVVNNNLTKLFSKYFPTLYKFVLGFKGTAKTKKDALSKLLRKQESDLWINDIAVAFRNKYPNKPIWILHDALLTTYDNKATRADLNDFQDEITSMVQERFTANGLNPMFNIDFYGDKSTEKFKNDKYKYVSQDYTHFNKKLSSLNDDTQLYVNCAIKNNTQQYYTIISKKIKRCAKKIKSFKNINTSFISINKSINKSKIAKKLKLNIHILNKKITYITNINQVNSYTHVYINPISNNYLLYYANSPP